MRKPWWPVVSLAALLVAIYWKLVFFGTHYIWFDHYDLCQLDIPALQFIARNMHRWHFPLWDPHVWAGLPVIGSGQPGPLYPLNLLFMTLPLDRGSFYLATLNWWFIAIHFVAAFGMYFLCRDLNMSPTSSVLGGLTFSCMGFFGSMPWFDRANAASLTPLIFLFAIRICSGNRRLRNAALLGLVLGLSWLSGHHEIPLLNSYAVLFAAIAVFAWRWVRWRRPDPSLLAYNAVAFVLAAAISAVQIIPLVEFGRLAKRWVGTPQPIGWNDKVPYYIHAQYSLPWKDLLGLILPGPAGEITLFAGFVVMFLAALALIYRRRIPALLYTAFIGAGALVYSLGAHTPLHRIAYELLPGLDKARTPERGMYLVGFALCVLAAWGADLLIERRYSLIPSLVILGGPGTVFIAFHSSIPAFNLVLGLFVLACLVVLICWRVPGRRLILIALAALEAGTVAEWRATPIDHTVCAASMLDHRELIDRLRENLGDGRLALNVNDVWTSPGNLYGFDQLISFVAGVPADVLKFNFADPETQKFFGVKYFLGRTPNSPADTPIATDSMGLSLYRTPPARPRAWVEHDGQPGDEPVIVQRPDTDSVVLRATLHARGVVVLTDVLYPGWEATVDGRPAPIQRAYDALRGVEVAAGTHTIQMHYRPASLRIGGAITVAGLLVFLLLLVWEQAHSKAQVPALQYLQPSPGGFHYEF